MAKCFLTNKAIEDLSKIWDYTYEVWSENQADYYYELIIKTCNEIAETPEIGKHYPEISTELFGFNSGKHVIFFRKIPLKGIEVLRILHGRMDLKNRLND